MAGLSQGHRLVLGTIVLIFVDLTWVASSELTRYIFKGENFNKPYFSTYLKTSMFSIYLLGFLFHRPWRNQCYPSRPVPKFAELVNSEDSDSGTSLEPAMSNSIFVPIKFHDGGDKSSGTESDENMSRRSVRFSRLAEVRQLADSQAEDALLARLSYTATLRAQAAAHKLPISQVAWISLTFCFFWFIGNLAYQESLSFSEAGIVNILSCSSGLFTLCLAALFPATSGDRFTFSKLLAVLVSIAGVVLITLSDKQKHLQETFDGSIFPPGAGWALLGALFYAIYIVFLRRKINDESCIDFPMFFGFVGLFTIFLAWPGLLALHYLGVEEWNWPTQSQWGLLLANGLVGTVLSELLWVWGCFLTSSLLATLATALTIPLSLLFDTLVYKVHYPILLYLGAVPMFAAFFALTLLAHYDNWDPVSDAASWLAYYLCRPSGHYSRRLSHRHILRINEVDREQTESLINADGPEFA